MPKSCWPELEGGVVEKKIFNYDLYDTFGAEKYRILKDWNKPKTFKNTVQLHITEVISNIPLYIVYIYIYIASVSVQT